MVETSISSPVQQVQTQLRVALCPSLLVLERAVQVAKAELLR
jgi:hypothetical protein